MVEQYLSTAYTEILKECIAFINDLNELECDKIDVMLKAGCKIDQILKLCDDNQADIKRLAREISRERKKLIPAKTLNDYRQLYISFTSLEEIKSMFGQVQTDLSIEKLLSMTKNNETADTSAVDPNRKLNQTLRQVNSLLKKLLKLLQDYKLPSDQKASVIETIALLREKNEFLLSNFDYYSNSLQLNLFDTRSEELKAA